MPPPVVQFIGGAQSFIMWTETASGATNPGLSFFAKVGIHRGAAKLAEKVDPFPQDQNLSAQFRPNVPAPVRSPRSATRSTSSTTCSTPTRRRSSPARASGSR